MLTQGRSMWLEQFAGGSFVTEGLPSRLRTQLVT